MGPMSWFWVILGIVLIGVGLLDLFLSALDDDESGFLTFRLQAMQWRALRSVVRRLPGPWRAFMYAQVIGLQILLSLVVWVVLVIVGFGFVYYGLMYDHTFSFSGGDIGPSMDYAIYYSAAQLSTVGSSGVTPENTLLRALGVVETLIGLGLITLAISFLISIYQTITSLLTLSSDIYYSSPDARDPLSSLAIYFPKGQATCSPPCARCAPSTRRLLISPPSSAPCHRPPTKPSSPPTPPDRSPRLDYARASSGEGFG
jgi:hypothetical protein